MQNIRPLNRKGLIIILRYYFAVYCRFLPTFSYSVYCLNMVPDFFPDTSRKTCDIRVFSNRITFL